MKPILLSKYGNFHIPTEEMYHPAKPFDENLSIFETLHNFLNKNKILRPAAFNKTAVKLISDDLEDLKKT